MTSVPPTPMVSRRPGRPRGDNGDSSEVAERLLDAATELAVEQGFDACGLREIAARAEVSSGMISYYFGDRQGLYEAMIQRALERVSARIASLIDDDARESSDRLNDLVRILVETIATDPWLPKLILSEVISKADSTAGVALADRLKHGPMPMMVTPTRALAAAEINVLCLFLGTIGRSTRIYCLAETLV